MHALDAFLILRSQLLFTVTHSVNRNARWRWSMSLRRQNGLGVTIFLSKSNAITRWPSNIALSPTAVVGRTATEETRSAKRVTMRISPLLFHTEQAA